MLCNVHIFPCTPRHDTYLLFILRCIYLTSFQGHLWIITLQRGWSISYSVTEIAMLWHMYYLWRYQDTCLPKSLTDAYLVCELLVLCCTCECCANRYNTFPKLNVWLNIFFSIILQLKHVPWSSKIVISTDIDNTDKKEQNMQKSVTSYPDFNPGPISIIHLASLERKVIYVLCKRDITRYLI